MPPEDNENPPSNHILDTGGPSLLSDRSGTNERVAAGSGGGGESGHSSEAPGAGGGAPTAPGEEPQTATPSTESMKQARMQSSGNSQLGRPVVGEPTKKQSTSSSVANLPFVINITVEAKDPESIRELVNLLRELRQLFPST